MTSHTQAPSESTPPTITIKALVHPDGRVELLESIILNQPTPALITLHPPLPDAHAQIRAALHEHGLLADLRPQPTPAAVSDAELARRVAAQSLGGLTGSAIILAEREEAP